MKCLDCSHWKALDYPYEEGSVRAEFNEAEGGKIKDLLDVELGDSCEYGGGVGFVDDIYTNQNFFCVGFKRRRKAEK